MSTTTMQEAEEAAEATLSNFWAPLAYNSLVPVDPIVIAHEMGIEVFIGELPSSVSGVLIKERGRDARIVLNRDDHRNRIRFTCAHELGHYLRRVNTEADLTEFEWIDYRDPKASTGSDSDEIYANQFAAALLMPKDEVKARLDLGTHVVVMAKEFEVSADAMAFRIDNIRRFLS